MPINFPMLVYEPCYATFARPVIINPVVSQPGAPPYCRRGIFDTEPVDIEMMDGSLYSDTRTILDILEIEFPVLPKRGDRVSIPAFGLLRGGEFVVADLNDRGNAGGEITLRLKRFRQPKLVGGSLVISAPTLGRPRLALAVDASARLDLDNRLWRRQLRKSRKAA